VWNCFRRRVNSVISRSSGTGRVPGRWFLQADGAFVGAIVSEIRDTAASWSSTRLVRGG
jgi:hypothetical protein